MVKVLFVCHGNICRSPMAEFVMKDMVKKMGMADRFEIASCAASREEEGNGIYPPARRELSRHGIAFDERHRARRIERKDISYYDRIYYMDSRNARYLRQLFPDFPGFLPFLDRDVADPWYSGDFSQTWEDICEGCENILKELL